MSTDLSHINCLCVLVHNVGLCACARTGLDHECKQLNEDFVKSLLIEYADLQSEMTRTKSTLLALQDLVSVEHVTNRMFRNNVRLQNRCEVSVWTGVLTCDYCA